tara:strand:+ start:1334 stop:1789 length:456 start_codon:yes stop_codon:yes gene_type:complete
MIEIDYNVDEVGWKKNFPYFKKYISKTVNETIKVIDVGVSQNICVTFFLTSNKTIKELNYKYRKKNKPTNILSFPMQSSHLNKYLLGDIVMASQTLMKEASDQRVTKYDHLCRITIHGMLHLLGYDHKTEKQFKQMNKYEKLIYSTIKQKL